MPLDDDQMDAVRAFCAATRRSLSETLEFIEFAEANVRRAERRQEEKRAAQQRRYLNRKAATGRKPRRERWSQAMTSAERAELWLSQALPHWPESALALIPLPSHCPITGLELTYRKVGRALWDSDPCLASHDLAAPPAPENVYVVARLAFKNGAKRANM